MPEGNIRLWNVNTQRPLRTINVTGPVFQMAFHPSKQILAVTQGQIALKLYNPTTGQQMQNISASAFGDIDFHPNGEFLAFGISSGAGEFQIWKLVTANANDVNRTYALPLKVPLIRGI